MIRAFLSVGLWTLISRATGFARDVLLANLLGAGPLMDAFTIAFRLPNHFRAIFAEGAFNSAFVPAYTRIRQQGGEAASALFQGRILALVLVTQLCLLGLVLAFTPQFVALLAPGFDARPEILALATNLTRITFPYLALVTLVVLWSGVLNAENHFRAGAAAPVLLNFAMISTILSASAFPSGAHAAAWGVLVAGLLEAGLLAWAASRAGLIARPRWPVFDGELVRFFRAFGPALIGSAGVQIAMFADTIIVTFLPQGGASALYYADRLYQLPIGVIGIAAGTVLLPEMSRQISAGRPDLAYLAQNRALGLTWLLAAPFLVAFLALPDLIVAAMFQRGAFEASAVGPTANVLAAYASGLLAIVGIRAVVASFNARGDTTTPLYAAFAGIAVNLGLKLLLWREYGAAGLAFATAMGGILNFAILAFLAWRSGRAAPDRSFGLMVAVAAISAVWLYAGLGAAEQIWPALAALAPLPRLMVFAGLGALVYGASVALGFRLAGLPLRWRS